MVLNIQLKKKWFLGLCLGIYFKTYIGLILKIVIRIFGVWLFNKMFWFFLYLGKVNLLNIKDWW